MKSMKAQAHVAGLRRLSVRSNKVHNSTDMGPLHKGLDSFSVFARKAIGNLKTKHKIPIEKGLSDDEFLRIEDTFGFKFPPDLRAVLKQGVPVGAGFPDWRSGGSQQQLCTRLNQHTIAGFSQEVAQDRFWYNKWGQYRPRDTRNVAEMAGSNLEKVPLLVPLYGHYYIPSSPDLAGNPVYFVNKNDVVCCGFDLGDFFEKESFRLKEPLDFSESFRHANHSFKSDRSVGSHRSGSFSESFRHGNHSFKSDNRSVGSHRSGSFSESFRHGNHSFKSDRSVGSYRSGSGSELEQIEEDDKSNWDLEECGKILDSLFACSDGVHRNNKSVSEFPKRSTSMFDRLSFLGSRDNKSPKLTCNVQFQDKILAHKSLSSLAAAPPISPSKEFWTDLAEERSNSSLDISRESIFCSSKTGADFDFNLDSDLAKESQCDNGGSSDSNFCSPRWLMEYLEELETLLSNGGWKERDIHRMIQASSSSSSSGTEDMYLDRQTIFEGLLLEADLMSNSLRKAGWSSQDIAEMLVIH